jgi:hypothetical protein
MYRCLQCYSLDLRWGEVWCCTVAKWLSIPHVVVGHSRHMGVPVPVASVPSHTSPMDGTSILVAAVPTPVHCLAWTHEASSPTDHAMESDGGMATGAQVDI